MALKQEITTAYKGQTVTAVYSWDDGRNAIIMFKD